jgi:cytochrome bd ubiquinol oxidase subunit I
MLESVSHESCTPSVEEIDRGRAQEWGFLRTADSMTPFLTAPAALSSLILFCAVYVFIFSFGTYYIYRLLRDGPSVADQKSVVAPGYITAGE